MKDRDKHSNESKTLTIKIVLPKILYKFVIGYCKMANIDPEEFMYAAIMYSMDVLMTEKNEVSLTYIH